MRRVIDLLAIVVFFGALGVPRVWVWAQAKKHRHTAVTMRQLGTAVHMYASEHDTYPKTIELPNDGWGRRLYYNAYDGGRGYVIASACRDGVFRIPTRGVTDGDPRGPDFATMNRERPGADWYDIDLVFTAGNFVEGPIYHSLSTRFEDRAAPQFVWNIAFLLAAPAVLWFLNILRRRPHVADPPPQ